MHLSQCHSCLSRNGASAGGKLLKAAQGLGLRDTHADRETVFVPPLLFQCGRIQMQKLIRHIAKVSSRLRAANTIHVLTLPQLNRALATVWEELTALGFASKAVDRVPVWLVSPLGLFSARTEFNSPYGFFEPASRSGAINIPSISLSTLSDLLAARAYVSLRDILRHEYAHAIEHHHRGLIHCPRFEDAFSSAHDDHEDVEFDPARHVSEYAASCVGQEDYAETFMLFVKHGGQLPRRFDTRTIRRKWRFIADLGKAIHRNQRSW